MTRILRATALLVSLSAGSAFAQFEGLDLTDDAPKKDDAKKPDGDAEKPAASDGLDLGLEPAKPAAAKPPAREPKADAPRKPVVKKEDEGPAVERDVTQDDRVKSVQRKLYLKRGRFELAPAVAINVNDPYYTRFGGSVRAAFHPADSLAIAARFTLVQTLPTDDVRIAKKTLQSAIYYSEPYWTAMADFEWSPVYGKVAFFNSILHLDGYVLAGAGVVFTANSPSRDVDRAGLKPGFDLGLGLRFVAKDFIAVNVGLVNTTYVEAPIGTPKSATQNLMLLHAGLSIFFPFTSTYREAE